MAVGADLDLVAPRHKFQFKRRLAQRLAVHLDRGAGRDGAETDARQGGNQGKYEFLQPVTTLHVYFRDGRLVAFAADFNAPASWADFRGLEQRGAGRLAVDENFSPAYLFLRFALVSCLDAQTSRQFLECQPDVRAVICADLEAMGDIPVAG